MRVLFRDSVVQDHFERYGWAKVKLLNREDVNHLTDGFATLSHYFSNGFDTTATMADPKVKSLAREIIHPIFIEKTKQIFVDCKILAESFLSKGCGNDPLPFHQDWSFVEEDQGFTSVAIWSPLVDVSPSNGTIAVVSNTHRLPRRPRLAADDDYPYGAFQSVLQQNAQTISANAGEAVIWDSSLFHGSSPNRTTNPRPVAGALVVPSEARTVLYYKGEDDLIEMRASDGDFMLNKHILTARPSKILKSFKVPKLNDPEQDLYNVLGINKLLLDKQSEQHTNPGFENKARGLRSSVRRLLSRIIKVVPEK
jgi:hypothetical protein